MKKAWVENNRIRDIAAGNPADLFHPDIAALYDTDVPDTAVNEAELVGGEWVNPAPVVPALAAAPAPERINEIGPIAFKLLFGIEEIIAIYNSADPVVVTLRSIIDDPRTDKVDRNLLGVQLMIGYLEQTGLIGAGRAAAIVTGRPQ